MPLLELSDLTIAYDTFGPGEDEPVVLICGLSQPAGSWQLSMVPALADTGHFVVTFDNRGVEPSSAPPAPYSIDQMVDDTVALIDHLEIPTASFVGYSMGGWIAETLAFRHPDRVKRAIFIGSCNAGTSWEKAITTLERDMAALDPELPKLYNPIETIRYLPNHDLQNDDVVDLWLQLIVDVPPWSNPGRLGQYEAALAWSTDYERIKRWPLLERECLILAFEHDIDSPPARALEAASQIPRSSFVEIEGASHLGVFTHADAVAAEVVTFLNPKRSAAP